MALILAIEPNKNQAHQLNALVRTHLKAELVTAPTAAAALSALGDRVPDVVLTPALFGLRDEAALTERLRQLGNDAAHVQTLSIPILAPASSSRGHNGQNAGLLGRKKEKGESSAVGCDPAVFAEQIKIYLQRASVERRAQVSEAAARAMTTSAPAAAGEAPAADDFSAFMVSADELDVDSLELPSFDPPAVTPPAPVASAATDENVRRSKPKQESRRPSPVEEELGLVAPPASGPPLWRVTESIEDFYGNGEEGEPAVELNTERIDHKPPVVAPDVTPAVMARPAQTAAAPAPRPRRNPPQPGEWAYFDPSQSAFKALTRRLDEIAGSVA